MANQSSVSLTIDFPNGSTKVMEFTTADPIMIGSGESASVRIEDDDVSSLHCMIKPKDDGLVVLDLGSDEGTEVNGREITGETPIEDGDHVQLGGARVTVHFGGAMLDPTVPIRSAGLPGYETPEDEKTTPADQMPDDTVDMPTVDGGLPDRAEAKEADDKTQKAEPPPADTVEAAPEPPPKKAEGQVEGQGKDGQGQGRQAREGGEDGGTDGQSGHAHLEASR
jgi:predicted component of type VI protein secretion system